jgi:NADH-quinone oxidoreductase subunit N
MTTDLLAFLPGLLTAVGGILVMMLGAFRANKQVVLTATLSVLLASFGAACWQSSLPASLAFTEMIRSGSFTSFLTAIILFAGIVTTLVNQEAMQGRRAHAPEVYAMLLFAITGMVAFVAANHLLLLFVGLETMSIALYVLAGLYKNERHGVEAGLKYFILGAFASGFLLYGISFIYGATGSLSFEAVAMASPEVTQTLFFRAGIGLMLVGFFFKVSAVPFHMWTPDVYQGSPTAMAGFMSTASKVAAFGAFWVLLSPILSSGNDAGAGSSSSPGQISAIYWISMLSMIIGNLTSIAQQDLKRILGFSSIGHAGYLLIGFVVGTPQAFSAMLFYLVAYTLMNLGAFAMIAHFERTFGWTDTSMDQLKGVGRVAPRRVALLSLFMLSLAGFPPLAGFFGKYLVFSAAIEAGFITLTVIAILSAIVGAFVYLRVIGQAYFEEGESTLPKENLGWGLVVAVSLLAAGTLHFGVDALMPWPSLLDWITGFMVV